MLEKMKNIITPDMMCNLRLEYDRKFLSLYTEYREYIHGRYSGPPYYPGSKTQLTISDIITVEVEIFKKNK